MDFNEKTVIVIDHTAKFAKHSDDQIVLETNTKTALFKSTYVKSLWSNTVAAVLQYCRIVFDLFGSDKPFSLVTFDKEEKIHTIWLDEDQTFETLWTIFSHEGAPVDFEPTNQDSQQLPGLDAGCSMLRMLKSSQKSSHKPEIENVGRVIVLSAFMKDRIASWIPSILTALGKSPEPPDYSTVTKSEWIFIDIGNGPGSYQLDDLYSSPEKLSFPHFDCRSHDFYYHQLPSNGTELFRGMMRLVESHYHLASTLVQDIPMKEEANTSSGSAMYGVELIHSVDAHKLLHLAGLADRLMMRTQVEGGDGDSGTSGAVKSKQKLQRPNSGFSQTLAIKWITPKSSDSSYLRYATAAYRVTLADVGNRASTCLAQFVLGGRSVALAHRIPVSMSSLPDSVSATAIAGSDEALLLTCHGSVMYIHTLATVCPLVQSQFKLHPTNDDVSQDLRVQAFVEQIVRPSRLAPASASQRLQVTPRQRAQQHLERFTRYWPLFQSETLLGKNKLAAPLFDFLPREFLEPNEVTCCQTAIDKLAHSIKHNVTLHDSRKGSTLKRPAVSLPVPVGVQAEAVALALELDHFFNLHASISNEHRELDYYWRKCIGSEKLVPTAQLLESNFGSLKLSEQIGVARILLQHTRVPESFQVSSSIPDCVIKTMRSLKLLAKQSTVIDGDLKLKVDFAIPSKDEPVKFKAMNQQDFLNHFRISADKRSHSKVRKLEFCGVASADQKGLCQLYKNLRDKEKSAT